MVSSAGMGGTGTGTGSDTGLGGGGGAGGAVVVGIGGGMGRATGGVFFEQAPTTTERRTTITINDCARLFITDLIHNVCTIGTSNGHQPICTLGT